MKAVVQDGYGSAAAVLKVRDIDTPVATGHDVLVRVHAASVNPADWHLMRGDPYVARLQMGLPKPKHHVLGFDVAGRVEAVGENVTTFRPGDEVFGSPWNQPVGAFADYVCLPDDALAAKPANLSFEQAAAVPLAATTALQCLRDHGRLEPGQAVLVIGASGGVGTFAVQIAKSFGAEVTGVCSTRNVELVSSLGADHVIDYTREDFTSDGRRYDLIAQLAGTRSALECRRAMTAKGTLVLSSGEPAGSWFGPLARMFVGSVLSPFVSQRLVTFVAKPNQRDLEFLRGLLEEGKVAPVIDRTYSLDELPEAIAYLEEGHARGKVVITVA